MALDDRTGDVYVSRMTLIHAGKSTVIYDANTGAPLFSTNTTGFGPALLKITIN